MIDEDHICFIMYRSSHRRWSAEKGVLTNLAKFTAKHLCQSLFFNKVAGLEAYNFIKKRHWHRCFPVNFAKFLRTPFLQNTSGRLILNVTFLTIKSHVVILFAHTKSATTVSNLITYPNFSISSISKTLYFI